MLFLRFGFWLSLIRLPSPEHAETMEGAQARLSYDGGEVAIGVPPSQILKWERSEPRCEEF